MSSKQEKHEWELPRWREAHQIPVSLAGGLRSALQYCVTLTNWHPDRLWQREVVHHLSKETAVHS